MLDQYSVCGLCGTHHIGTPCPPRFTPRPYTEAVPKTVYVTYPYPPLVQMENGEWCETLDYPTLVKLVYDLRNRVNELEKSGEKNGNQNI